MDLCAKANLLFQVWRDTCLSSGSAGLLLVGSIGLISRALTPEGGASFLWRARCDKYISKGGWGISSIVCLWHFGLTKEMHEESRFVTRAIDGKSRSMTDQGYHMRIEGLAGCKIDTFTL